MHASQTTKSAAEAHAVLETDAHSRIVEAVGARHSGNAMKPTSADVFAGCDMKSLERLFVMDATPPPIPRTQSVLIKFWRRRSESNKNLRFSQNPVLDYYCSTTGGVQPHNCRTPTESGIFTCGSSTRQYACTTKQVLTKYSPITHSLLGYWHFHWLRHEVARTVVCYGHIVNKPAVPSAESIGTGATGNGRVGSC